MDDLFREFLEFPSDPSDSTDGSPGVEIHSILDGDGAVDADSREEVRERAIIDRKGRTWQVTAVDDGRLGASAAQILDGGSGGEDDGEELGGRGRGGAEYDSEHRGARCRAEYF